MDGKYNLDNQTKVQSTSITFPVFISVVGIISVALAVMLYHLLLIRYCRHSRFSEHPSPVQYSTSHQELSPARRTMLPVTWFGLDERALESIPVLPYCERALEFFRIDQSECVVCLGKLEHGDRVRWLPSCAHAFHVACIDNWLRSRANCPMCRARVVVPPPMTRRFAEGGESVRGGLTRARSGGTLRRDAGSGGEKTSVSELEGLSLGLKKSFFVDDSCIVIGDDDQGGDRDSSCLNDSESTKWRPTTLVRSILGFMVHGEDRGVLPY